MGLLILSLWLNGGIGNCVPPIWPTIVTPEYGQCPRPIYHSFDIPSFVNCMTGPLFPPRLFEVGVNCGCKYEEHDSEECAPDGDLDLRDFARFQNLFIGG